MKLDLSMYEYMRQRDQGDGREAMNYYRRGVSYPEFNSAVDSMAEYLQSVGVVKGDSILICLPNTPNAVIAFYAINKVGAIANIVHPLMPPLGLERIMDEIPPKVVFVLDVFYRKYNQILGDKAVVLCSLADYMPWYMRIPFKFGVGLTMLGVRHARYAAIMRRHKGNVTDVSVLGSDTAVYLHSGGTTGEPKTVMLSNTALNAVAANINSLNGENLEAGTSMLMVLPMFHVFGLGVCMHSTLCAGARALILPFFKARATCSVIRRERATFVTGVPQMFDKMMNYKSFSGRHLQIMRYCYCGGDKLSNEIKDKFTAIMRNNESPCVLSEGYGLTEAGICTVNTADSYADNSVGVPIGSVKTAIIDAKGNRVAENVRGEICIGGESVMQGYYGDKATTDEVLITIDKECYVRTGDIGYVDTSGHLFYIDRMKRMLKISGINVFPSEIESLVIDNFAKISRVAAVRQYSRNGKGHIKLCILMRDNARLDTELKSKILAHIADNLMRYSVPREVVEVSSLPYTAIGKVDYSILERDAQLLQSITIS